MIDPKEIKKAAEKRLRNWHFHSEDEHKSVLSLALDYEERLARLREGLMNKILANVPKSRVGRVAEQVRAEKEVRDIEEGA